ncbi:hypothetical protein ACFY04_43230 [Streptomyces sp. NPDC001549]|uniref:hypothetical protein n=1 Tax=Streptomyces sp. NPDC001549 TaxID=3364586 RepID=UPI0036B9B430
MPYLNPTRSPLTPERVERAFDYLIALQTGGGSHVAGRAEADPELAFLLLRVAEDVIWPMAAVGEESDPHSDSFALEEAGCILSPPSGSGHGTPPPPGHWASPAASSASS